MPRMCLFMFSLVLLLAYNKIFNALPALINFLHDFRTFFWTVYLDQYVKDIVNFIMGTFI